MTTGVRIATTISASVGGDVVDLALTVRNEGDTPVTLRFRSGQRADFCAYPQPESGGSVASEPIWRASEGRLFTQALATTTLAPDETARYTDRWSDPPSGQYRIVGAVTAEVDGGASGDGDVTARTTVDIP